MESRLNYYSSPLAAKVLKHLVSASKVLSDSALPDTIQPTCTPRRPPTPGRPRCGST